MEMSMEFGREIIEEEVNAGLFNFFVKPIVRTFYNYWSNTEIRKGIIKQIKTVVDCAKSLLNATVPSKEFDNAIEDTFPDFLDGDSTSKRCKKTHKNYKKLEQNLLENFHDKIKEAILFLKADEDNVESYEDLTRAVYETKEMAYKALITQLNFTDDGIKVIETDLSILDVPAAKKLIVRALRRGFEKTKEELISNLDATYD